MPRNRFVTAKTKRLELSDGDWIEVKERLNVGEKKTLDGAGVKRSFGAPPEIDWPNYHIKRAMVWLVDWSFQDEDGKQQELTEEAVRALDPDDFDELQIALVTHIAEGEAAKKAKTTTPNS